MTPALPTRLGAWAFLALALAFAPFAAATHVTPTFIDGPDNHTCSDFADGAAWLELKVDPPQDGSAVSADAGFSVELDFSDDSKTVDWTASAAAVVAVFVKDGEHGHFLYEYDPAEDADTGLTTPGEGAAGQISHVSICYMLEDEPTCEDNPDMPECQPTCEDTPDLPECQETCEDNPDLPGCQDCEDNPHLPQCGDICEENPEMPECQETCEDNPDMPQCQECPATVTAIANASGTVTVTVMTEAAFELHRQEGTGNFTLLGSFVGNVVYEDDDTTPGTVYTYKVMVDGEACGQVMVTAIPDFPMAVGVVAAAALGAVGYALLRRKA